MYMYCGKPLFHDPPFLSCVLKMYRLNARLPGVLVFYELNTYV